MHFPLFLLIRETLIRVRRFGAQVVMLVPMWPRQHWFTILLELAVEDSVRLLLVPDLITQDLEGGRLCHPKPSGSPPSCMEPAWLTGLEQLCLQEVQKVLLESRKPTRALYKAKWRRFALWPEQKGG